MFRTIRRAAAVCTMLLALAGLVACGGQTARQETGASAASPAASVAAATTASVSPTASASAATTASPAASAATSGRYAGIAQSKTAEGYYALGDAAAPVTLMHYSDFL
jgi:protein-disulfide isomerase